MRKLTFVLNLLFSVAVWDAPLDAGNRGSRVAYIGGTRADLPANCDGNIQAVDETYMVFYAKKASLRIPYDKINLLEYGQKVDRRYAMAVLISPFFLLSKKRQHFLTVGYNDEEGRQQAMIFRVDKNDIRSTLVSLEARTGQKVQYQDGEARKAGKG